MFFFYGAHTNQHTACLFSFHSDSSSTGGERVIRTRVIAISIGIEPKPSASARRRIRVVSVSPPSALLCSTRFRYISHFCSTPPRRPARTDPAAPALLCSAPRGRAQFFPRPEGDGRHRAVRGQPRAAHAHQLPRAHRARLPGPPRRRRRRPRARPRRRAAPHLARDPAPLPPPRRRARGARRRAPRRGRGVRAEHPGRLRAPLRHSHGRRRHLLAQLAPRRRHGVRAAAALGGQGRLRRRRAAGRRAGSAPPHLPNKQQQGAHRGADQRRGPRRPAVDDRLRVRGPPQQQQQHKRPRGDPVACRRERADRAQLHVGDDVAAQGRGVHAPRGVPQLAGVGAPQQHGGAARVPVDGAHVPLQRVVPGVGRGGAGRHQRLPPQGHLRRHLRRRGGARGHAHGRRAHGAQHGGQRHGGGQAPAAESSRGRDAAGHGDDGRRAAGAAGAVPDGGARVPRHPLVRADGDVRPRHGVHVAARVGRAAGAGARRDQVPAGAPPPGPGGGRQGPRHDAQRPRRRAHRGGGHVPGQHGDGRVLQGRRGDGGGHGGRVAQVRGPGGAARRRRVREDPRPVQGHRHLGRGEHQHHRGRGGAVRAPGRGRRRRRGPARRVLGRDAVRVRHAQGRRGERRRRGGHSVLPRAAAPVHGAADGGVRRRAAQDGHRQGAEVRAPGAGQGHGQHLHLQLQEAGRVRDEEQALNSHAPLDAIAIDGDMASCSSRSVLRVHVHVQGPNSALCLDM